MTGFTNEMIEKAKLANNPEEILELAKENGMEMTLEQAKKYCEQLSVGCVELDDDMLDVAGGGCGSSSGEPETPADYGYPTGQRVYYCNGFCGECSDNGFHTVSKNFVLEWVDYPGGSFCLNCEVCGGRNLGHNNFFSGDPSIKGIVKV